MDPVFQAVLESWQVDTWLSIALPLSALVYLLGFRRLRRSLPERFPAWRALSFVAGIFVLYLATASPLDAFGSLSLSAHMSQHFLFMMVGPPLLWLGSPALPLLMGLPRTVRRDWLGPFLAWPALRRVFSFLAHPVVAWVLFVASTWLWHVPGAYEAALQSRAVHEWEHFCFLFTALLFWYPVVRPWPGHQVMSKLATVLYLLLADVQNTVFSAFFCFSEKVIYPIYEQVPRLFSVSALDDQAAAGVIMWVPGSIILLVPVFILITRALGAKGMVRPSEGALVEKRAAPIEEPSPYDWLTLPGLGGLLRRRGFRITVQVTLFLAALLVVLDGFFGPQVGAMNAAGVLPWTHWRGFLVIGLLLVGNLFCFGCPFTLPRRLLRSVLPEGRAWPRALRSKWLAIFLLLVFLFCYEVFALWDRPSWTAWIIVGYFLSAFTVDVFFREGSFCKHVCPIGQFNFIGATLSPLQVGVKSQEVCAECNTHDCLRGGEQGPGCNLDLFQPEKAGNLDCTFCLDCVRACPTSNVALLPQSPGAVLAGDARPAWLGRRMDMAVLVLILSVGAFFNAAGMVGPVQEEVSRWITALDWKLSVSTGVGLLTLAGILAAFLLFLLLSRLVSGRGEARLHWREAFSAHAFALVPLGFAMWAVHFGFHLATGAGSAVPVIEGALAGIGFGGFGEPDWVFCCATEAPSWLLPLEMFVLDLGLLLSWLVGWRAFSSTGPGSLSRFLPLALTLLALWAMALWILFQPMQMRGTLIL